MRKFVGYKFCYTRNVKPREISDSFNNCLSKTFLYNFGHALPLRLTLISQGWFNSIKISTNDPVQHFFHFELSLRAMSAKQNI